MQHRRATAASIFQNGISQNTKCNNLVGFPKSSHICNCRTSASEYKFNTRIITIHNIIGLQNVYPSSLTIKCYYIVAHHLCPCGSWHCQSHRQISRTSVKCLFTIHSKQLHYLWCMYFSSLVHTHINSRIILEANLKRMKS